jgi:hypothetical protein
MLQRVPGAPRRSKRSADQVATERVVGAAEGAPAAELDLDVEGLAVERIHGTAEPAGHVNHRDEAALVIEVAVGLRFEGAPLATARHVEAEDDQPRQGVAPIVVML